MNRTILVIGYIPLLYPHNLRFNQKQYTPGNTFSAEQLVDSEEFARITEDLSKQAAPRGILWDLSDQQPHLCLYMDEAKQVYDHFMYWCENKPETWFSLCHQNNEKDYTFALIPESKQMIRRYKMANALASESGTAKPLSPTDEFQLVCQPLAVTVLKEGRDQTCYEDFCRQTQTTPTAKVSFIDTKLVESDFAAMSKYAEWTDHKNQKAMLDKILSKSYHIGTLKTESRQLYERTK